MTCRSRTGFAIRLLAGLALIAALLVAATQPAPAAKPSGSSSTPTGTIYHTGGSFYEPGKFIWGFKPSGIPNGTSGAFNLLPGFYDELPALGTLFALPIPCRLPQGSDTFHDRWWVAALQSDTYDEVTVSGGQTRTDYPHYDLYAMRSDPNDRTQLIKVQLTDLYGMVNCNGGASWSNDTNEAETSFVMVRGYDIRNTFVEDAAGTFYDQSQAVPVTLRIPLKASKIPLQPNEFVPVGPAHNVQSLLGPDMSVRQVDPGIRDISSDTGLEYVKSDPNSPPSENPSAPNRLVIADATIPYANNPIQILWDGNSGAPRQSIHAVWSPDGTTIAFIDDAASTAPGGDIWTCSASGGSPPKRIVPVSKSTGKNSSTFTYRYPVWSPDSKHLAYLKWESDTATGALKTVTISRVSISDGKTFDIAAVFYNNALDGTTLRWAADN